MIAVSREVVLAVDSSKFGRVCFSTVLGLGELSTIVTDIGAPEPLVAEIRSRGVEVVRV
jgi:DeoR/GlpR family transcriptional regulator of sugar metabolism